MIKIVNSNDQLPFATDAECKLHRVSLIANGSILPGSKSEVITRKDGTQVLSTKHASRTMRERLIEQGLINPNPEYPGRQTDLDYHGKEEGKYEVTPITTDAEYQRKRALYLWMVHDILKARRELKLVFGQRADDPDWFF